MPFATGPAQVARFKVEEWMAFGLGLETRADWIAWSKGTTKPQPEPAQPAAILPSMLRRRISTIGQMAFRASYMLSEQRTARFVFCSRHGEFDRTLRILNSLYIGEPISPADFSLSVHNALAGFALDSMDEYGRAYRNFRRRRQFRLRAVGSGSLFERWISRSGSAGLF